MTGNESGNTIAKVSRNSQQNTTETVTNEHDEEIPKERYLSSKERQKKFDSLDINITVW